MLNLTLIKKNNVEVLCDRENNRFFITDYELGAITGQYKEIEKFCSEQKIEKIDVKINNYTKQLRLLTEQQLKGYLSFKGSYARNSKINVFDLLALSLLDFKKDKLHYFIVKLNKDITSEVITMLEQLNLIVKVLGSFFIVAGTLDSMFNVSCLPVVKTISLTTEETVENLRLIEIFTEV
jgi:hypothetical protein